MAGTNGNGRKPAKNRLSVVRKAGRPTSLTPKKQKAFLSALAVGVPYTIACDGAGINISTFHNWRNKLHKNPENEGLKAFFGEIKRVEALALQRNLDRILAASEEPRNWTASAWWCERRYPQHFGKALQVTADVQTTNTERKELVLRILSDDNTRHHANELACRIASAGVIDADSRVAPGDNGGSGQQGEVDLLPPSGEVV